MKCKYCGEGIENEDDEVDGCHEYCAVNDPDFKEDLKSTWGKRGLYLLK